MTQPANREDDLRGRRSAMRRGTPPTSLARCRATERREFEAHLATCRRCSAAVAELSGIPALLAQLTAEEVEALDDPAAEAPPLRPEVLDIAAAEGRVAAPSYPQVERDHAGRRGSRVGRCAWWSRSCPGIRGHDGDAGPMASAVTMSKVPRRRSTPPSRLTGFGWGTRIDMVVHLRRLRAAAARPRRRIWRWSWWATTELRTRSRRGLA